VLAPIRIRRRPRGDEVVDARHCEQRGDVIRFEQSPRRLFASLHERRLQHEAQLGERRACDTRAPCDAETLQDARGDCLLRGDEPERLQILADERAQMLQVVAPKQAARTIAAGERLGAHYVGKIRVGIGGILPLAHARDLT
jgi:hypothetical protein